MLPNENIFGDKKLKVTRHVGDLKTAFVDGEFPVYRTYKIFIQNIGLINCAPMDNHFVFSYVFNNRGWTLWCTCGSPAAVVGYNAYAKDASPGGELIVCMHHAMYNLHGDGSS